MKLNKFGSWSFPIYNRGYDLPQQFRDQRIELPTGESFDLLDDSEESPGGAYRMTVSFLQSSATASALDTALKAMDLLGGTKAKLYKEDSAANLYWEWARLIRLRMPHRSRGRVSGLTRQQVQMTFMVDRPGWNGETENNEQWYLDSSPDTAEITNDGNGVVKDLVLTITAAGSSITQVDIENLETGHVSYIRYAGTILAGQALVIDTRDWSVKNNGVNAYGSDFTRQSAHTIFEWLRLKPSGNSSIRITRTGGSVSSVADLDYYDRYK